ncbi:MAG: PAS domain S-box protein [Nitrospira sp.]|nr:PAS domain S-box protein [Nitrospira sp.]
MVPLTLLLVKQELIARAGETVALGAADIADKLDLVLNERLGDIQAFARSPLMTQHNPEQIIGYLDHLKQLYPMYERLSVVDIEGQVIASTDHTLLNQSWQSESWIAPILHDEQPHAEIVRQPGRPDGSLRIVRFAVQLHTSKGPRQGIIVTEISERTVRAFVTQTTQRSSRSTAQPEITEFMVLSKTGETLLTSATRPEAQPTRDSVHLSSTVLANQGHTGYVEEVDTGSGIDTLTGYAPMVGLPQGEDFQWRILVRADRRLVLQSIWTLLWKLVGIGTVCLLPLLGLFYWSWQRQVADKTRAMMALRALEANEARIRKIVDIALDAVVTIDDRGLVTGWNPQAEQIFGWQSGEVIGQSLTNTIIPPRYREAHERGLRHYAQTGTGSVLNKRIEITALDRTGREFPIELSITPMHLDGKTIFSAFLRDITERKQAEDELRRAQTAAESASRAKTEFLANMSHELRTPLNAIVGTSDLLLKTSLTSEQRQCALMSQRSSQALLRLVNDVLDLAKIEAGTVRVESAPFDLKELLERTMRLMELRQHRRDVALTLTMAADVPAQLEGDGFRLQQILLNLLGNALKFTDRGSVSLAVSRDNTHIQRPRLRFEVSDTGIGIPADHLEHIFDRFTQVDSGDSRKYGGTGLGLSICKQLTQLMEGTIQVASELGKGSTFTVALPFSTTTAVAVERPPQATCDTPPAAARPHPEAQPSTPVRLLLVDDSPEIGQLAALYLKGLPYQLDRAADGPSAIQQFQTHRYDLIFMDLQMPGMDGYATATAIRTWEAAQGTLRTPIIALTADVLGPAKERSLHAGCTGFIGKPFLQTTFLEAIQQYARPADSPSPHERIYKTPPSAGQPEEPDLDRLRQKFLSNRRRDLEALASALSTHDWATIQTLGHRMKGLAGSYGFEEIGAIGIRLEKAAVGQEPDRITSGIEELAHILERLDPSQDQAA